MDQCSVLIFVPVLASLLVTGDEDERRRLALQFASVGTADLKGFLETRVTTNGPLFHRHQLEVQELPLGPVSFTASQAHN